MKRELERIEIAGEHDARERAWSVVRAAFAEREPEPQRRSWKPAVAVALAVTAFAALLSPPGRAVLDELRAVVGVEKADRALFSLPAPGRLLVTSDAGAWVVDRDGSKRLLGTYREASWSPFGRFVVASRENELVALEPDGDVRWSLARAAVRVPRWGGTRTDTRIAYLAGTSLRVVAGDGRGDHRLARRALAVAPAWRPGSAHVLTYARDDGIVRAVDAERGTVLAKASAREAKQLGWVADRRLTVTSDELVLRDDSGGVVLRRRGPFAAAAISPRAQALAAIRLTGGVSTVEVTVRRGGPARKVFSGAGRIDQLAWSPDGRWLLLGWRDADQWVFVRVAGGHQIRAVANVSRQFHSRSFPTISAWCCAQ